jgi:hypothetical protein
MTDGFLSRWSRRKLDVQEGRPVQAEPLAPVVQIPTPQPTAADGRESQASGRLASSPAPGGDSTDDGAPEVPLPTLADAQALTPQSDFKPFMARGVAADIKNAAMKKLFTDPHYNVMDRLDTYIDDYSLPDPIPEAMLRQMVSAKFLNLFDEKEDDAASADALNSPGATAELPHVPTNSLAAPLRDDAHSPTGQVVAQSQTTLQPPIDHDHLDMRLQPDHAPEGKSPGRSAA